MSACEKCWRDAQGPYKDVREEYQRLIAERSCTPEEQAGEDATQCPKCSRMTLHQYTREPMCGCSPSDIHSEGN